MALTLSESDQAVLSGHKNPGVRHLVAIELQAAASELPGESEQEKKRREDILQMALDGNDFDVLLKAEHNNEDRDDILEEMTEHIPARVAVGALLQAYPPFLEAAEKILPVGSPATKFLRAFPEMLKEFDRMLEVLRIKVDATDISKNLENFGVPKLARGLAASLMDLLPQLEGKEMMPMRSGTMTMLGALERFQQIIAIAPNFEKGDTSKRGLPASNPEAGIHAHALLRLEFRTKLDGRHVHILIIDGQIFISIEDGEHWHVLLEGQRRSAFGDSSKHRHKFLLPKGLRLPSGMVLEEETLVETEEDGDHDHDLIVFVSAFDGTHDHKIRLPDGTVMMTISAAEFAALNPDGLDNPPEVGAASEVLKTSDDDVDCPECEVELAKHLDAIDADFKKAWDTADNLTLKSFIEKQTEVQSFVLSKERFKTVADARAWVKENGGRTDKVDETENTFRFRQFNPSRCKEGTFRNKRITDGVLAVICVPKTKETPEGLKNDTNKILYTSILKQHLPIIKTDEERFVLGIVLEPETVDSQGEIYSEDVIRKTAHGFMEFYKNMGLMHREIINGQVAILESYLAPVNFEVNGQKIKKGTWLLGTRIIDNALWSDIKSDKITGYSIGGSAIRVEA